MKSNFEIIERINHDIKKTERLIETCKKNQDFQSMQKYENVMFSLLAIKDWAELN